MMYLIRSNGSNQQKNKFVSSATSSSFYRADHSASSVGFNVVPYSLQKATPDDVGHFNAGCVDPVDLQNDAQIHASSTNVATVIEAYTR